jgi:hypothetical protein
MVQIKRGTVFSARLLQLTKNVRQIQSVFTYLCFRTFNKFSFPNIPNNKDGISFMWNGSILLLVGSRDWSISMWLERNGYKLMSELPMPSLRYFNKKEGFLKSRRLKKTENLILRSIWINKLLRRKVKKLLVTSSKDYKFINQLLTPKKVNNISIIISK